MCYSQVKTFLQQLKISYDEFTIHIPTDVDVYSINMAVPIKTLIESCDMKDETTQTLFSLLEEEEFSSLLSYNGKMSDICVITLKKRELEKLAKNESIAKLIIKCGVKLSGGATDRERELNEMGGTARDKGFNAYCLGYVGERAKRRSP